MAIYSQRQFLKVFNLRQNNANLPVLIYIWHNDTCNRWEIDYCNKVTKDTMRVSIAAVNHVERDACLMMLEQALANANQT